MLSEVFLAAIYSLMDEKENPDHFIIMFQVLQWKKNPNRSLWEQA